MHIASSGEGINEITRILAKKWLLAVAIEKLHFCLCNSSLNFCLSTFAAMLQPLEKLEEEGAYSKQLFSDQQKKALPNAFLSLLIRIVFSNRSKKTSNGLNHFLLPLFFVNSSQASNCFILIEKFPTELFRALPH